MLYTFFNNGKPYDFTDRYCGGGKFSMTQYTDIEDIAIVPPIGANEKKGFLSLFAKPVDRKLVFTVKRFSDIKTVEIPLKQNEIDYAKQVVSFVCSIIVENKKQQLEQQRKLDEAKKTDTIDVVDTDGNIKKIYRREVFFKDMVLIAEGGTAYHTHADCYESWKPQYQRTFKHWVLMSKADAEKQGLTECKLCQKYYEFEEDEDNEDSDY